MASLLYSAQFSSPQLKIERPKKEIPTLELQILIKKDRKIKKISNKNGKDFTEYDINGNLIKKVTERDLFTITENYQYKNGILIKKTTTEIANEEEIKKENERNMKRNESVSVFYKTENKEHIYSATLDHKNRILSYQNQKTITDENNNKNTNIQAYSVSYIKNKISEINAEDYHLKLFYEGKNLVKEIENSKNYYQHTRKIYDYSYDKNNNLIVIKFTKDYSQDGIKYDKQNTYTLDSANYDNKNRIIWAGTKNKYSTYKYFPNGRISEINNFEKQVNISKTEFFYEDDLLTKLLEISYTHKKINPVIFTSEFKYDKNRNLIEQKSYSPFSKEDYIQLLEYEEGKPIKYTDYYAKENDENLKTDYDQRVIYEKDYTIIDYKYGKKIYYEFY